MLSANSVPSILFEKTCGQTDKQTNKQTNKQTGQKLDQSQDIVTGNAFISSEKIVQNAITSNRFHIPAHQFRNIFIKKHFTKIKYLTKNLVPYHCTSI